MPLLADFVRDLGLKKVAVLYINSDWGRTAKDLLAEAVKARGGEIVGSEGYLADEKDFRSAIVRLREQLPDVQVEAGEASGEQLGQMVAAGELHAAMCFQDAELPPRRPEGTERHELGTEAMFAVLATSHPLAARERIAIADLADATWTAPSRDHLIYRACVAAGFEPRIAFVTRDVLAARGLIASGLAVTLMPALLAAGLPDVAMVPLDGPQPHRSLYALTPASGVRSSALAFLDALRREVPQP
jgi:DNA-binding transcriptional LysR family regulator